MAMQIGLVPSLGSRPPNGTTDFAERPESGVVRNAAHVALSEDRGRGHAVSSGLLDGHLHQPFGNDVAEPPVAVDDGGGGRIIDNLKLCAGHYVAALDAVDVRGNLDDAVRVVSGEVGADGVEGDDLRLFLARSRADEKRSRDVFKPVCRYCGHRSYLALNSRGIISCFGLAFAEPRTPPHWDFGPVSEYGAGSSPE